MGLEEAKLSLREKADSNHPAPVSDDTSFKLVVPDDPLLDLVYEQLILPFFTDNERDERHAIYTYLAHNEVNREKKIQYYVVAALKNGRIIGTTIFSFIGSKNFCFMNGQYTSVVPEERRQHLARRLSDYRVKMAQVEAKRFGYRALDLSIISLSNSQNGSSVSHNSSPGLATLQKIWRGFGHERIDFPFIQLPLADGKASSPAFLRVKRHSDYYLGRNYLTKEEMKCIVDACNYFRISKAPNTFYPEYLEMLVFLERHSRIKIG